MQMYGHIKIFNKSDVQIFLFLLQELSVVVPNKNLIAKWSPFPQAPFTHDRNNFSNIEI